MGKFVELFALLIQAGLAIHEAVKEYQAKRKKKKQQATHEQIDTDPDSYADSHGLLKQPLDQPDDPDHESDPEVRQ